MHYARLQRVDPDDPRWRPPPNLPPTVSISMERDSSEMQSLPGMLFAYDWTVDGRVETLRPDDPFDTSSIEVLNAEGANKLRFEIHSQASPVSITVTRVFDLGADNPNDFDSIAERLSPGRSEPDGLDLMYVESDDRPRWRLDVPLVATQEPSHITIQAMWSDTPIGLDPCHMASWLVGLSGDPNGQTQADRIEMRDRRRDESGPQRPAVGDGGPIRWSPGIDMGDLDEKVSAAMMSPVGRALATIAAGSGLSAEELASPETSVWLCSEASNEIEVWNSGRDEILAYLERESPKHEGFLREILAQPSTAWWFEPLVRERQIWVSKDGSPPSIDSLITPSEPPTRWERYAHKPVGGLFTSTLIGNISSMLVAIDLGVGDLRPAFGQPPYAIWRMDVDESARVFEIDGSDAWHRLCVDYPAEGNSGRNEPDFSRDPGKLVPDWSKVARDWDAVHMSFGGYLTSDQVRVESESGWTYHWAWDCEQTLWLRWMFTGYERLEDYREGDSAWPEFKRRSLWRLAIESGSNG